MRKDLEQNIGIFTPKPADIGEVGRSRRKTISRRNFLAGATAVGLVGLASIVARKNLFEETEKLTEVKVERVEDILLRIKTKFGVEIPTIVSPIYSKDDTNTGETRPNIVPTLEEAKIIAETIEKIPATGFLAQIIIPFRNYSEGAIAGGSYTGYQWPVFLHRSDYVSFPYDRLVSNRAAIELQLPNAGLNDKLPEKTENSAVLPFLSQISHNEVTVKIQEELPWTTHGERFRQTLVHEFGHGLEDQVRLAEASACIEKYANEEYCIGEYWAQQGFTLINKNTIDTNHPLYVSFANLTGWQLVPHSEFVRQFDPELAEKFKPEDPTKEILVWDRDPSVWGDLENRKMRLTTYASYGPIQETFEEFWMASILYPQFLTDTERKYFGRIHQGLRENPQGFVQSIAKNQINLLV